MRTTAGRRDAAGATAIYAALTIVFTWPLVRGLATDVAGDFGDPLLNSWILAWDATHLLDGWRAWWNANIFHPHPLALAYSEHLAAPAIQILPIYWLTANPILCYNLLFLSTFVLSGLGMFLFVRELTGDRAASFVAGLAYAFAPYRIGSLSHLQVLSSAWMPFVLFGFRRYFESRRSVPLAGAALAWILQNLSCGYYLLFFAPIVGAYLAWELMTRRVWRDAGTLWPLALACAVVWGATLPFLLPYLELRRAGFSPRSLAETQQFSADVYAYLTADTNLRVWGSIVRAWPRAEGSLFPGLTVIALAATAVMAALKGCPTTVTPMAAREGSSSAVTPNPTPSSDVAAVGQPFRAAIAIAVAVAFGILLTLLFGFSIRLPGLKITSLGRALVVAAVAGATALGVSRTARQRLLAWLRTPAGLFALLALFAIVMSFGPQIHARGRVVLDTSLYAAFYRFVPGFDGLRVPARFGMIVALALSVLAGLGLSALGRAGGASRAAALALAALVAIESFAAPIPLNEHSTVYARPGLAALEPFESRLPDVYTFVLALPPGSAIVELPLGEPAFDVRYMYFSTRHWRPLVNGYTGGKPRAYELLDLMLQDLFTRPDRAWAALRDAGPTHVIVHESYYSEGRGSQVCQWLRANGAREVASYKNDRVFALP